MLLTILADAAANAPDPGQGGGLGQLLIVFGPLIIAFLVINHLVITRPQQKEQQRHQEMLGSLKKNDRVVTAGGIIGTIVSVSEDKKEVTLRVDDNARIKFRAEYIRGLLDDSAAADSKAEGKK